MHGKNLVSYSSILILENDASLLPTIHACLKVNKVKVRDGLARTFCSAQLQCHSSIPILLSHHSLYVMSRRARSDIIAVGIFIG